MDDRLNRSIRLAYCSVITAVAAALMFLTGVIPAGSYAVPALSGVLSISVVVEFGVGWGWAVYFAVSLLSAFIAADKEAVLIFILFLGYYPILKSIVEKKAGRILGRLLKLAIFNAAAVFDFFIGAGLLGVPKDSYTIFNHYVPWIFLLAGNITFLIYDYALSLLAAEYWRKLHPVLKKIMHLP